MTARIFALSAAVFLSVWITGSASAFDSAESSPASVGHLSAEDAADFSKAIERDLAANGARLAMVFRSGQARSELPDQIRYTHGAFWVYQDIRRADGSLMKGYAVYNLYHGDGESRPKTVSYLKQDFPLDFTLGAKADDVGVIIPEKELQRRIINAIADGTYEAMHVADYSLVSNAADPKYQNCNEFLLDVIAASVWETRDYLQIKANLEVWFEPTVIKAGLLKRLVAPMIDERIRLGDQSRRVETVSFESLVEFLDSYELMEESYVLYREGFEPNAVN